MLRRTAAANALSDRDQTSLPHSKPSFKDDESSEEEKPKSVPWP